MIRRVQASGILRFFVIFTLLGISLAACGGGGGESTPLTGPVSPTNLQSTTVSSSAIDLFWTDASNNEDGFKVYRGTTAATVTTLVATLGAGATSYTNTGLTPSATYHYKITAFNPAGESETSNVTTATTQAPVATIPAAPLNLQGTDASSSAIDLSWTDASDNEDGFKVYRGTTAATVTTLVATLGAETTSYTNTGLIPSTTYYYFVMAYNSAGESVASNIANTTTLAPPVTIPLAPSNLSATAASSTIISLAWIDASGNESGFRVFRGTGTSPSSFSKIAPDLGANATAYTDNTASASTTYVYWVLAFNSAGESSPAQSAAVTTPDVPASVDCGNRHSLALLSDGTVRAWGSNTDGALGVGSSVDNSLIPILITGLTGVSAISAGDGHSLALMNNGAVKGWGENSFGGVGSGDNVAHYTPVDVFGLTGVSAISAGGFFSIALKNDGTVWTWGKNDVGQLGNNTFIDSPVPVQVGSLTGVAVAVSAGQYHSLALKNDGTVWAWGKNDVGQLGNNTFIDSPVPVQVKGPGGVGVLNNVLAISAGEAQSLALLIDGTVRAWGENFFGELGDGTTTTRKTPVQVHGLDNVGFLNNVLAVSAGGHFSVALKNDETVWAWGSSVDGQIGDGTGSNRQTPVQVHGLNDVGFLNNVQAISSGQDHTLAMKNTTAWAWGNNGFGQIGDDTTTTRLTPVPTI